jgi:DNA-binding NarL/FixJ family response regulator
VNNPWRLTARQCEAVSALVRIGCNRLIARELGLKKPDTVGLILHRACAKVGVSNRVQLAVEWDRWERAHRA